MSHPDRRWIRTAMLAGIVYVVVAIAFAALARSSPSRETKIAWRLGAWLAAAVVFAAHFAHEQFRRRRSPRAAAGHVSAAVAMGAFALAVWINVHPHPDAPRRRSPLAPLALVVFPAVTGVPAFLAAFAGASLLKRRPRRE